jgi:hypothetical protein
MRSLVHLIAGSTGAGKITYVIKLAKERGAIRVSRLDGDLVWARPTGRYAGFRVDDASDRPLRGDDLGQCPAAGGARRPVGSRSGIHRNRAQGEILRPDPRPDREAGLHAELHHIDVPADERWLRVQQRNAEKGRDMFDFVERLWEPPTDAEIRAFTTDTPFAPDGGASGARVKTA